MTYSLETVYRVAQELDAQRRAEEEDAKLNDSAPVKVWQPPSFDPTPKQKVVRVPLNDGEPAGEPEDFVAGWQVGRRWWGRPVDVIVAPDGALLTSDDFADQIYRVWWIGDQPAP